ncbi:DUF4365 domain-containing protein [Kribbella monticola]|uniref:DUF4365 domain-containing protein n=1 Tax=Kribbella monticola TaxID=2185285 RepID=UPI000DD4EBB0|nr:DUF4365 domain-containing protein [Kribbella monticola]
MPPSDNVTRGHNSRLQGNYGEAYVRAMAASIGLRVSKEEPEPEGVDLLVSKVATDRHRSRTRAEFQVKTTAAAGYHDGVIRYSLRRPDYLALTGTVGVELDIRRYLILVVVPTDMASWAVPGEDCLALNRQAYWADLMGPPVIDDDQQSLTVSVPCTNLLTPTTLLALVSRNYEEVA